jgi:hypothetical protein
MASSAQTGMAARTAKRLVAEVMVERSGLSSGNYVRIMEHRRLSDGENRPVGDGV